MSSGTTHQVVGQPRLCEIPSRKEWENAHARVTMISIRTMKGQNISVKLKETEDNAHSTTSLTQATFHNQLNTLMYRDRFKGTFAPLLKVQEKGSLKDTASNLLKQRRKHNFNSL